MALYTLKVTVRQEKGHLGVGTEYIVRVEAGGFVGEGDGSQIGYAFERAYERCVGRLLEGIQVVAETDA